MSEGKKSRFTKYAACAGVCLLFAALYVGNADILNLESEDQLRILSDAFTLPGLLCIFSGLMIWMGNEGAFDGITYVLSYAFHALLPGTLNKRESYKDYRERKRGKKPAGFAFLLITGVGFTLVGILFLAMFHMV